MQEPPSCSPPHCMHDLILPRPSKSRRSRHHLPVTRCLRPSQSSSRHAMHTRWVPPWLEDTTASRPEWRPCRVWTTNPFKASPPRGLRSPPLAADELARGAPSMLLRWDASPPCPSEAGWPPPPPPPPRLLAWGWPVCSRVSSSSSPPLLSRAALAGTVEELPDGAALEDDAEDEEDAPSRARRL